MSPIFEEIARGQGQTLNQLARLFPPARRGKPVSLSCILRWVINGIRLPDGSVVRLEAARCSGRWLSSPAAIQRFLAAQTPSLPPVGTPPRTPRQRSRADERARRELAAAGI
jgi:hypothetical protein